MIHGTIALFLGQSTFKYLSLLFFKEVWDDNNENNEAIKRLLRSFNSKKIFLVWKINAKVEIVTETVKNIFRKYIPYKKIKFDYKYPKWMSFKIIWALKKISKLANKYCKYSSNENKKFTMT